MKLNALINMQLDDGSFGPFHSMSSSGTMTTERALRRFYHLNLTSEQEVVKKTLDYVLNCLNGDTIISDRREKVIHWDFFCDLMFSAWLFLFSCESSRVTEVRRQWITMLEESIVNGAFDKRNYEEVYRQHVKRLDNHERAITPTSFYVVVLVRDGLSKIAKKSFFEYTMQQGIYYISDKPLTKLPENFGTKNSFNYLEAIRLIKPYTEEKEALLFVKEWLDKQVSQMDEIIPHIKTDGIIFPKYAEDWRNKQSKRKDIIKYLEKFTRLLT